jgi:hypothetical protein
MLLRTQDVWAFWALLGCIAGIEGALIGLEVPPQFSADVHVTSHLLNETQEYPPWRTHMKIYYDLATGRARADVFSGHQAGKTFIRRYDQVGVSTHLVATKKGRLATFSESHYLNRTEMGVYGEGRHLSGVLTQLSG